MAEGERSISVGGADESVLDLVDAGAPIKNFYFPNVANYAQSADMAVLKGAAHVNAAMVFVNWYLSKAGQEAISTIQKVASFRKDVPNQVPASLQGTVISGGKLRTTLMESRGQSQFASDLQNAGVYEKLPDGSQAVVSGYETFKKTMGGQERSSGQAVRLRNLALERDTPVNPGQSQWTALGR